MIKFFGRVISPLIFANKFNPSASIITVASVLESVSKSDLYNMLTLKSVDNPQPIEITS